MASGTESIELRLRSRITLLYVLVAFLYAGLLLDLYLTFRVFYREDAGAVTTGPTGFTDQRYRTTYPQDIDSTDAGPQRSRLVTGTRLLVPPVGLGANERNNDRKSGYLSYAENSEGSNGKFGDTVQYGRPLYGSPDVFDELQSEVVKTDEVDDRFDRGRGIVTSDNGKAGDTPSFRDEDDVVRREKRSATSKRYRRYPQHRDSRPSIDIFDSPQPKEDSEKFVWLTSHSRILKDVLEEHCIALKEQCPPGQKGESGLPGMPGLPGLKGERGDRGFPGDTGPRGPPGFVGAMGISGIKGEPGKLGIPGLDGRNGIPGEPGLDGVPGRDGIDAIPGRDGIPGMPGSPGRPGTNGTNGIPGSPGPRGPEGPQGPKGATGPRGKKGPPGDPGKDGEPGIRAWSVGGINDTHKLLIPPSIVDTKQQTTLIVEEGDKVRLQCTASGQPKPHISWKRLDNKPINSKSWQQSSIPDVYDIYRIRREQRGIYRCIASNGVPPDATLDINVEVTFPPLIKIFSTNIETFNGSYAFLECMVEAYPPALNFWLHGDDQIEPSWKYKTHQKDEGYKTVMSLNITRVEPSDYGRYKCVSRNEKGQATGVFTVFKPEHSDPTKKPQVNATYFGQIPPSVLFKEPECEPCETQCQPSPFCTGGGSSTHSSKVQSDFTSHLPRYNTPPPRRDNCMIHQLGKPVFQRSSVEEQGSWYQDSSPLPENEHKFYVTYITDTNHLYEFESRDKFRSNNYSAKYDLQVRFAGNAHVVYNGSFYFQQDNSNDIIRFEMSTTSRLGEPVIGAAFSGDNYLYSTEMSYMDITADENGLWVIYSNPHSNNTIVRKLNSYTLKPEFTWNISLQHRLVGDMFICCGVLYAVDSVSVTNTQISFAYDLYQTKALDVNIPFSNPFRQNSMITYNPNRKKIFTWDKGNQLVYPILFGTIDLGQPENADNSLRNRK